MGATGVTALAVALLVLLSFPSSPPPLVGGGRVSFPPRPRAVGVLHVHSRYSDGAGTVDDISAAARGAGLDFLVLTDHGHMEALRTEGEGYDQGVLRLVGTELSTEQGHILALDIPEPLFRFGSQTGDVLQAIAELGGFAIVAHPSARRANFAWTGWDLPGYTGVELFNFFSGWRRQRGWRTAVASGLYFLSPRRALAVGLEWDGELLGRFDKLQARRKLVGWAGLDAHGRMPLLGGLELEWPGYRATFAMVRNHLILDEGLNGDPVHDRAEIYQALRQGRGYVAFDGLADASRFTFQARQGSRLWPMGSQVPFSSPPVRLEVAVDGPPGTGLVLLRDGELLASSSDPKLSVSVHRPGVYRAEARLAARYVPGGREQPWIVANPIFILPASEMDRRSRWLEFPPAPSTDHLRCEPLGDRERPVDFHPEHDIASMMDEESAHSRDGSFSIVFRLAEPAQGRPYVWCAVADRSPRDLSAFDSVRFRVRGDDVFRVDFQLRDAHPGGSDEDTEWWVTSFKISREWKEVTIPFRELHSITTPSDGRLDLDLIRGLFFVLDAGNTRPGVSGEIAIEDLQLCRQP
ncbi:MAG: CehA/McbA family metallohydrolase [Acidobacteriota bacterium]